MYEGLHIVYIRKHINQEVQAHTNDACLKLISSYLTNSPSRREVLSCYFRLDGCKAVACLVCIPRDGSCSYSITGESPGGFL